MRFRWTNAALLAAALVVAGIALTVMANHRSARAEQRERAGALAGGDAARGAALFAANGCGGCHTLRGATQASGQVGPPLDGVSSRAVIAGVLENTPGNMARWIADPQSVVPGNAMPTMALSHQDARDITAYLYSES